MKKFDKVIFAVKGNGIGWNRATDLLFKKYENAVIESHKPYRDRVRKQFITNEQYYELERLGAFED